MYNFLVTGQEGAWDARSYEYPRERFCEYTAEAIKTRFSRLTPKAIKELKSIPSLFVYEGTEQDARIGYITRITERGRGVFFEFEFQATIPPIPFEKLEPLMLPLDIINRWELTRTHWAIKDEDLLTTLASAGVIERGFAPANLDARAFVKAAIEASIFAWPDSPGLTHAEIAIVGKAFSYKRGELSDAVEASVRSAELILKDDRVMPGQIADRFDSFTWRDDDDLRSPRAFEAAHNYMLELAREHGIRAAVAARAEVIDQVVSSGVDMKDAKAALVCLVLANHFEEEERSEMIRLVAGRERWSLPSEQLLGATTYNRGTPKLSAIRDEIIKSIGRPAAPLDKKHSAGLQSDSDAADAAAEALYDMDAGTGDFGTLELDVREVPFTVSTLLQKIRKGQLVLTPAFQRRQVWKVAQQSRFVEAILLNYPLPPLFLNQDREGRYLVIDGLQRTSTLKLFSEGRFALQGLDRLHTLNGKKWDELPTEFQSRIEDRTLNCYVLKPSVPVRVINDIFARINTGGTELNRQEIRHALYQGPATVLLDDLSAVPDYQDWIGTLLNPTRMGDLEGTLRCIAFARVDPETAYSDDMDEFLVRTMKELNLAPEKEHTVIAEQFGRAWPTARRTFGDNAFRLSTTHTRGRINLAVTESVYRFITSQSDHWFRKNEQTIQANYRRLLTDPDYLDAVRYATGDRNRVKARFRIAREQLGAGCAD